MFRIDDPSAAEALPTPGTAGTPGYFTGGNPVAGTPATIVTADFLNMLQEELMSIVIAGGATPDKTTHDQVSKALKLMYSPVIGTSRNATMSIVTASASATFSADEIIVGTELGGQTYRLANFSQTVNIATTGAGGMDTGTAPVSGFVALYAIYNPTTQTAALLAVNATSAVAPEVYGGVQMPAGYTASALLSVWATNASGQFVVGSQRGRRIAHVGITCLTSAVINASPASLVITAIPKNAKQISGALTVASTAISTMTLAVFESGANVGGMGMTASVSAGIGESNNYSISIVTPQTIKWSSSSSAGTPTFSINSSSYEI